MTKNAGLSPLEQLSVLVVDDDIDDIFITSEYLKAISHFDIKVTAETNYKKAEDLIATNAHDVYFIDYLLGPHTGIELILSSVAKGCNKPFILLTGKGYRTIDMEAMKSGAYDYLIKGEINSEQLERSIRYSLERYRAYISLLESETRYKEIFAKTKDIIFIADEGANLINFNEAMPQILEYNREELLNMNMEDLFETKTQSKEIIDDLSITHEIKDREIILKTKTGERKYFIASGIQIRGKNDEITYQGLLHDYTLRKSSEKENVLNEKVGAISRLVRTLAHEIRNPLTNINLAMEQLAGELKEEDKVFSEIVMRNSGRINNIISDLVNLSKSGDFKPEIIDVRELLDRTLDKALDRFELKGIQLVRNYQGELVAVNVDMEQMQMALLNIIINAIEASEKLTGKVEVEITRLKDSVIIKICDNGCGINAEAIPSLFEPYFTRKKNGMGLGLATAHNIIKLHKGTIEVQSESGKGSEFIIKLPGVLV